MQFWEFIDEFLNAILFVLIGVEVLVLTFSNQYILAGCIAIPLVLLSRGFCVGLSVNALRRIHQFSPHVVKVLTWSGLRGGISVALALSIPQNESRDLLIVMTYIVVVFSILVQGLTVKPLVQFALNDKKYV